METTTLPIGQPSSQPTSAPSRNLLLNRTDLPKLFLYAGLAGLLTAFVICIIRVLINHFYLCNYKSYTTGTDATIEIIREADIQLPDRDIHHATVVSCISSNFGSHSLEAKGVQDIIRGKKEATMCLSRSISHLSTDSNELTSIAPTSDVVATEGSNSNGVTDNYTGINGRFSFGNPGSQPVTVGIPIVSTPARAMHVMEAVHIPESSNTGKNGMDHFRVLDCSLARSSFLNIPLSLSIYLSLYIYIYIY